MNYGCSTEDSWGGRQTHNLGFAVDCESKTKVRGKRRIHIYLFIRLFIYIIRYPGGEQLQQRNMQPCMDLLRGSGVEFWRVLARNRIGWPGPS